MEEVSADSLQRHRLSGQAEPRLHLETLLEAAIDLEEEAPLSRQFKVISAFPNAWMKEAKVLAEKKNLFQFNTSIVILPHFFQFNTSILFYLILIFLNLNFF